MIANLFKVATEFKFEIGSALLASDALQGRVEQLSNSADQTLMSFQKMGLGIATNLGIAELSVIGLLKESVKATDKYRQTQLAFSNIISSNREHLQGPIDSFNDRLIVSQTILEKISKLARDFSLDEQDLIDFSKLTAGMLVPKGLAGDNFGTAIDISRNLLKSAPTLGISTQDVQGQLLRMVEGNAHMGDTLFRRLVSETSAFQGMRGGKGGATQMYNALTAQQRVEKLSAALKQFASDTDVLQGNVDTVAGQFRRLNSILRGPVSSIFRPIGDALQPAIVKMMKGIGTILDHEGRQTLKSFAFNLKKITANPENTIIGLMQVTRLKGDSRLAAKIGTVIAEVLGLHALLHLAAKVPILGGVANFLISTLGNLRSMFFKTAGEIFMFLINPLRVFGALRSVAGILPTIGKFFLRLAPVLAEILTPAAIILTILQTISRAIAIAHVDDVEAMVKLSPRISDAFSKMATYISMILSPITELLDAFAHMLAPLFRMSNLVQILLFLMESLNSVLLGVANIILAFKSIIWGLGNAILSIMDSIMSGQFKNMLPRAGEEFVSRFNEMLEAGQKSMQGEDAAVAKNVTNIGTINIQNSFKEQLEPDRIAFSLKSQLLRAAQNPTQAQRSTFTLTGAGR